MNTTASTDSRPAPWPLFASHSGEPFAFFLDRGEGDLSFAGSSPESVLVVDARGVCHEWPRGSTSGGDRDPFEAIADYVDRHACDAEGAPGSGAELPRTVGYLSYELASFLERGPSSGADPSGLPLALLCTYDRVDGWDPHKREQLHIAFNPRKRRSTQPSIHLNRCMTPPLDRDSDPNADYRRAFARIRDAIAAGEIYQANLSRRIWIAQQSAAATVYRRLRRAQPVPRGAFIDTGAFQILSNSPETFLKVRGAEISTFPIKGTRPRSADPLRDRRQITELTADPKELAEHVMIVDLERNDLGRVCRIGSIEVASYARPRTFATVHHLESEVRGRLVDEAGLADILRACFPGGSITGAPKIKAMEIISEVETCARGVYTGAIGCFNGSRSVDLSVAIRTAVCREGRIVYSAGGGIVADSNVDKELDETETKSVAFRRALLTETSPARALAS